MTEHNWSFTLFLHFFFIFLSFLDNKIQCVLKLSFFVFSGFIQSTIRLHCFQLVDLLLEGFRILLQYPYFSYFLSFFLVPLQFFLAKLLPISVGRVHDFAPFVVFILIISVYFMYRIISWIELQSKRRYDKKKKVVW